MPVRQFCLGALYKGLIPGGSVASTIGAAAAQGTSKTDCDSRGRDVVFPLGDASFADEIVSFTVSPPP